MPRFTRMLADGMRDRGHSVEVWMPQPKYYNRSLPSSLKKWMGYIDQFLVFPKEVKEQLKSCPSNTLFVFTDHALGPWVPLVRHRPHIIHCHDFLAQRSAMGQIEENHVSWTGRQYQALIRRGYSQGKCFISVSEETRKDLHRFLSSRPEISEVVYNGLNQKFSLMDPIEARKKLGNKIGVDLSSGYLLHVGGNQWYKNRIGVVESYNAYRARGGAELPLVLLGDAPDGVLLQAREKSLYKEDVFFLSGLEDQYVRLAYSGSLVFLFPSLAEGFGWPIAEAMASGCPVITTCEAPMTEVAGEAAFLVPPRPKDEIDAGKWAIGTSIVLDKVLSLSPDERIEVVEKGIINAERFDPNLALTRIESIYSSILKSHNPAL